LAFGASHRLVEDLGLEGGNLLGQVDLRRDVLAAGIFGLCNFDDCAILNGCILLAFSLLLQLSPSVALPVCSRVLRVLLDDCVGLFFHFELSL